MIASCGSPGATGCVACHCSKPTPIRASSRAISAWSNEDDRGTSECSSSNISRWLTVTCSTITAFFMHLAHFQFATQQVFERLQVQARLGQFASSGRQDVEVD